MGRRGGSQRGKKPTPHHSSSVPVQPGAVAVPAPVPALPYGSIAPPPGNTQGLKACPQCQMAFNSTNCRPVQEACGHWKCRTCMIANEDGCPQCRQIELPQGGGSGSPSSVTRRSQPARGSNLDDIDLMPPVLIEEEPITRANSGDKGLRSVGQVHETPPKLLATVTPGKGPVKRKQKEASPSAPSKILKTSVRGSSPQQKKSDPRERPKIGTRRSSSSSLQSSSPRPSSRSYRPGDSQIEEESQRRSGRVTVNNRKSTSTTPTNQLNSSVAISGQPLTQAKEKGRVGTSAPNKEKFSFASQSKSDEGPSFAITISPTTIPAKATGSLLNKTVTKGSDDLGFSITSVSSGGSVVVQGSTNSNDGSNSNSLETCDPLYISNEWNTNDSNSNPSEGQQGQSEAKKKKKRSPVVIHDHITTLSGDPPLYQCNVCMKKFKTKAHIKYHEFCQNGEKPFKCGQCGQGFIAKSHYEYHLRTHTGERPYVCPKCGKGFNQRGKVTRHMRSHTGEKPFICQQCGRGFANAQALRSHFLIHTGERPFACQYCNKRFTGMTNLKKHVITHTGERPFMCNHCGKSFGLKWTLDLHLRTHSTERPFQCDQCARAFSNSKDLRRHLVIHSGERPFKCWICGTAFRRKDNLDRHIKNTHNQPKEVAKQLANEAAAEYMAQTKANQVVAAAAARVVAAAANAAVTSEAATPSTSRTAVADINSVNSVREGPTILRSTKEKRKSTSDVIITADLSPPDSPQGVSGTETTVGGNHVLTSDGSQNRGSIYVLPSGQPDIPATAVITTLGTTGGKATTVEAHFVSVGELEGLAELRTVPVNEYHQLEGIKLLEQAKSSGNQDEQEVERGTGQSAMEQDSDQKPEIGSSGDLLFCGAPGTTDGGRNFSQGLTVTVVYENDGKTHFITDQPSQYSGAVDPLSFATNQTTGLMAIPRETLFSFATATPVTTGDENSQEDSSSQPSTSEIHLKKSETILSGNLSKYLQMDSPKNVYTHSRRSDAVISSDCIDQADVDSKADLVSNEPVEHNSADSSENVNEAFPCYPVKNEIDIEYGTSEMDAAGDDSERLGEERRADSPLSTVSEASADKSREAVEKDSGHRSDTDIDPLRAAGAKTNVTPRSLCQLNDLEEGEIGKDGAENSSTNVSEGERQSQTGSESRKTPPKDTLEPDAQDNYSSDPMFQDPNADDEEKLQQQQMEDSRIQTTVGLSSTSKSADESIVPDGIDTSFGNPEAIFGNNMVPSRRKDGEGKFFRGVVDKECPASILQDETSNCGSVDPISDDEDFNESFHGPESPLEAGEIPRRRLRESIDMECPEEILQPENDDSSNALQLPAKPPDESEDALRRYDTHSHGDTESISSVESISSTELEPDELNAEDHGMSRVENISNRGASARGIKHNEGATSKTGPEVVARNTQMAQVSAAGDHPSSPASSKKVDELSPRGGRTDSPRNIPEEGELSQDSDTCYDNTTSVGGARTSGGGHRSSPQIGNMETETHDKAADNKSFAAENQKKLSGQVPLGTEQALEFDSSETEPISDTELEDDDMPTEGDDFYGNLKRSKRKRDEDPLAQHVRAKIIERADAEKILAAVKTPREPGVSTKFKMTGPKNAYSPTAATQSIQEDININCKDSSATCNSSLRREVGNSGASVTSSAEPASEGSDKSGENGGDAKADSDDGCDSDVETAEKSTQCMQTEDYDEYKEEEGELVSATGENTSQTLEDYPIDQPILVSNVRSLGVTASPVSPASSSRTEPTNSNELVTNSGDDDITEIRPDSPLVIKSEPGAPLVTAVVGRKTPDAIVGYEISHEKQRPSTSIGSHSIEMISPEPPGVTYVALPEAVAVPSQARLIYANPLVTTVAPAVLVAQPVNFAQSTATTSSYGTVVTPATTAPPPNEMVVSNYRIVYAPEAVPTTSSVSTYSTTQPSFRFIYENGEPVLTENVESVDNNMKVVYACAAATADPPGNCGPQKLKLLYAEALGVGAPDESGQVQLVYTSTAPNQNIVHAPNQNVRIYSPTFLTADTSINGKNIEMLMQQPHGQATTGPVPVEVLYNGNGTVMAQTVGQPQDLSWIRRDLNHSFTTGATPIAVVQQSSTTEKHCASTTTTCAFSSANTPITADLREIANHHNYASNPYLNAQNNKRVRFPTTATFEQQQQPPTQTESDGLRTLARAAATRMFTIQADADATTRAAAAIAAVGREAQIKRQMDMIERNRNLPGTPTVFIRKGENVPHRGPRKHYLSQLTNSRK